MGAAHICTSGEVRKRRLLSKFGNQIRLTAFASKWLVFFIQESLWLGRVRPKLLELRLQVV